MSIERLQKYISKVSKHSPTFINLIHTIFHIIGNEQTLTQSHIFQFYHVIDPEYHVDRDTVRE